MGTRHTGHDPEQQRVYMAQWYADNRDYRLAQVKAQGARGGTKRGPWSVEERAIAMEDRPLIELAYRLGRPYSSVRTQRQYLRDTGWIS